MGGAVERRVEEGGPKSAQAERTANASVIIMDARGRARTHVLGDRAVIGRDASCEIQIDSSQVSREHALILRAGQGFSIEDLKSRNGTRVNGKAITESTPLENGDMIEVANVALLSFSSQHDLEERLLDQQKTEILGRLAGGLAQDFNEVIGTLITASGSIKALMPKGSEPAHDLAGAVGEMSQAIDRAKELTAQLRTFAKPPVTRRTTDVASLLEEVSRLLRRTLGDAIPIEVSMERGLTVRIEPQLLPQTLMRLALHAARSELELGRPVSAIALLDEARGALEAMVALPVASADAAGRGSRVSVKGQLNPLALSFKRVHRAAQVVRKLVPSELEVPPVVGGIYAGLRDLKTQIDAIEPAAALLAAARIESAIVEYRAWTKAAIDAIPAADLRSRLGTAALKREELLDLCRFFLGLAPDGAEDKDKAQSLVLRLFEDGGDRKSIAKSLFDPAQARALTPSDEQHLHALEALAAELTGTHQGELSSRGFLQRFARLKSELGASYWHPRVLERVIDLELAVRAISKADTRVSPREPDMREQLVSRLKSAPAKIVQLQRSQLVLAPWEIEAMTSNDGAAPQELLRSTTVLIAEMQEMGIAARDLLTSGKRDEARAAMSNISDLVARAKTMLEDLDEQSKSETERGEESAAQNFAATRRKLASTVHLLTTILSWLERETLS
jgi:pSer/pThr/pTyr-binding forkhead associated (FHA) protein